MEQCEFCVYFNGDNYCLKLRKKVLPSDICGRFEPNDEFEKEDGIPFATDEGYDVATA